MRKVHWSKCNLQKFVREGFR